MPKLKDLLNAADVACHPGTSIVVPKGGLARDGLPAPDRRFNDRMVACAQTTFNAFIAKWAPETVGIDSKNRPASLSKSQPAIRASQFPLAARGIGAGLHHDRRCC